MKEDLPAPGNPIIAHFTSFSFVSSFILRDARDERSLNCPLKLIRKFILMNIAFFVLMFFGGDCGKLNRSNALRIVYVLNRHRIKENK